VKSSRKPTKDQKRAAAKKKAAATRAALPKISDENPCTKCGVCCELAPTLLPEVFLAGANGSCIHLLPDYGGCAIYETRPKECRVRTWKDSAPICNDMQDAAGLGEEWRVKL